MLSIAGQESDRLCAMPVVLIHNQSQIRVRTNVLYACACIGRDDTLNLYPAYASGHLLGMASFVSVIAAMMHVQYYGNGIPGRNRFAGRARLVVRTGSC